MFVMGLARSTSFCGRSTSFAGLEMMALELSYLVASGHSLECSLPSRIRLRGGREV